MTIPNPKAPVHQLEDWRDASFQAAYQLEQNPDRIDVAFPEKGAHVWIEYEVGRVRIHCFHKGRDEPINVEIYEDRIEIDDHDYLAGD